MSGDDKTNDARPLVHRWPWTEMGVRQWEARLRREALEGRALMDAWLAAGEKPARSNSFLALSASYLGGDYD